METDTKRPDAFREMMAAAQASGRPELAHQSLSRALTSDEDAFAEALMAIYADGTSGEVAVAEALNAKNVARPSSGNADWTAENLARELHALNADLDAAYQDNGFGA